MVSVAASVLSLGLFLVAIQGPNYFTMLGDLRADQFPVSLLWSDDPVPTHYSMILMRAFYHFSIATQSTENQIPVLHATSLSDRLTLE